MMLLLFPVALVACFLPSILAQSIAPSNGSLPAAPGASQLMVTVKDGGMIMAYKIDALTPPAGENDLLSGPGISGNLRLVDTSSIGSLGIGDLAYVSCDPSAYQNDNLTAGQTMKLVADRIHPNSQPTATPGAIILYSLTSTWCTFSATDSYPFPLVYSITNSTSSQTLFRNLNSSSIAHTLSTVSFDSTTMGNGTGTDNLSSAPTTAVTMIVLYSITGIITSLFLLIILTGAWRAHRHPERYGPRLVPGGLRQSRARGIARAMLDTLPIVKFGEREESKPSEGDIELGQAGSSSPGPSTSQSSHPNSEPKKSYDASEASKVTTVKVDGALLSPAPLSPAETTGNGLACSVCTDDFVRGQDIRLLPCNHKFHPECIDPWLLNVSGTCPLCRVDLRPVPTSDLAEIPGPRRAHRHSTSPSPSPDTAGSPGTSATPEPERRPTPNILNIRRVRDATHSERLDALRRLRNFNRQPSITEDSRNGSRPVSNRFSKRLSRILGGRNEAANAEDSNETTGETEHDLVAEPGPEPTGTARGRETESDGGPS